MTYITVIGYTPKPYLVAEDELAEWLVRVLPLLDLSGYPPQIMLSADQSRCTVWASPTIRLANDTAFGMQMKENLTLVAIEQAALP